MLAMLAILASWAGLGLIFAGLGALVRRACTLPPARHGAELIASFWLGWVATITFLQLWHFFRPVDGWAWAVLTPLALTGLCWPGKGFFFQLKALFRRPVRPGRRALLAAAGLLLAALWLANRALDAPAQYDSGLYHFSAVRWAASYPLVPGLGNLHGRLAFNQSYFLYVALLDVGPWEGRAAHLANGLLLVALLAQLILAALGLPRRSPPPPAARLLGLLLLVPALEQGLNVNISSPSPDMPVFIIGLVLGLWLMELLDREGRPDAQGRTLVLAGLALGVAGLTVKFNLLVLGLGLPLLGLGVWLRRAGPAAAPRRLLARALAWLVLLLVPWMARDIVLSGYVAYPIPHLSLPVPWRLPRAAVLFELTDIRAYAHAPLGEWDGSLFGAQWLGAWLARLVTQKFTVLLPLGLTVAALVLWLGLNRRGLGRAGLGRRLGLFLVVPAASLAFWFVSAPDPRFAASAFWLLAAGANALLLARLATAGHGGLARALALAMVTAQLALAVRRPLLIAPGPECGLQPIPRVALRPFTTASGLLVHVPVSGDQCWDGPLPCTPYPNPALALRRPGDLAGGFIQLSNAKVPLKTVGE